MIYKTFAGMTLLAAPLIVIGIQTFLPAPHARPIEQAAPTAVPAPIVPAPIVPVAPPAPPAFTPADSAQPDTAGLGAPMAGAGMPMTDARGVAPAGGSDRVYSDPVVQ